MAGRRSTPNILPRTKRDKATLFLFIYSESFLNHIESRLTVKGLTFSDFKFLLLGDFLQTEHNYFTRDMLSQLHEIFTLTKRTATVLKHIERLSNTNGVAYISKITAGSNKAENRYYITTKGNRLIENLLQEYSKYLFSLPSVLKSAKVS